MPKTIPKMLLVHGEPDIPKDLCGERREFLESNKRVNVCTYDKATIKHLHFKSREFISFNSALPFVRH